MDLSIWFPFIVVLVGGIVTYFVTITIEERKRHYELKRQAYFEFIDLTTTGTLVIRYYQEQAKKAFEKHAGLTDNPEYLELLKLNSDMSIEHIPRHNAARIKVQICGSEKVKKMLDEWAFKSISEADVATFDPEDERTKKVIDAMKEELLGHWWQFLNGGEKRNGRKGY